MKRARSLVASVVLAVIRLAVFSEDVSTRWKVANGGCY